LEDLTSDILRGASTTDRVLKEIDVLARPYPVGLFVYRLGPLVANDAYATLAVWRMFRDDLYHSPRVVWGREVNLLVLGLTNQMELSHRGGTARAEHADALLRVVDLIGSSLVVQRSHDANNRKGGRADVLPIPAPIYPSEFVQIRYRRA
jgi:hypothetical protein